MKLKAFVGDDEHAIEIDAVEGGFRIVVDGAERFVDAVTCEASFYSLIVDGTSYEVSVREERPDLFVVRHGGYRRAVKVVDPIAAAAGMALADGGRALVEAVMPGKVVKVLAAAGDEVRAGQGLVVLEAMKMENEVPAPRAGKVLSVDVVPGQTVESGSVLVVIE